MQIRIERLYNKLLQEYGSILSDSRIEDVLNKQVKIVDSSTISLFKNILNCVGRKSKEGKSKGGIKVHTVINADEIVPKLVWFSPATRHDHNFLEKLKCDDNTIYKYTTSKYPQIYNFCLQRKQINLIVTFFSCNHFYSHKFYPSNKFPRLLKEHQ